MYCYALAGNVQQFIAGIVLQGLNLTSVMDLGSKPLQEVYDNVLLEVHCKDYSQMAMNPIAGNVQQ